MCPGADGISGARPTKSPQVSIPAADGPRANEGNEDYSDAPHARSPRGGHGVPGRDAGMTASRGTTTTTSELEEALLGRLGLDDTASAEQIGAAHEAVEAFLSGAPRHLAGWARRQAAAADEAYALLTDPVALARSAALVGAAARLDTAPDGSATPPVRREPTAPVKAEAAKRESAPVAAPIERPGRNGTATPATPAKPARHDDIEPSDDELAALIAEVTPSAHRDRVSGGGTQRRAATSQPLAEVDPRPVGGRLFTGRRVAIGAILAVGLLGIGFGAFQLGGGGKPPAAAAVAGDTTTGIDQAVVSAAMEKISQNPNDTEALQTIADQYFNAQQFATAATFLDKILAIDPKNIQALLGRGATAFNQSDAAGAKSYWTQVLAIDPKNAEAHYDLGYLYMSTQDYAGMQSEWQAYLAVDPESATADQVRQHLAAFAAQASASPGASGAAASAGASPAASPGASAAPAASTAPSTSPSAAASAAPATPAASPAPGSSTAP
jgi:cytochrome c-type biogenesis protein CcmH/NrfG